MEPWRPLQRSFYNYWGEGQGYVDIFVNSVPTAVEPHRVDRAHIVLYQQNRSFLVGAPPYVENEGFLTPPIHESWIEDLRALDSFEQTVAGQAIASHIRSVPHLRDFVQDYFINAIANEARDTAETAASLQHRMAWVVIDLNITIHFGYDGAEDDNEDGGGGGSYVDEEEAEGGDAEVGDAEVDPAVPEEVGADAEVQQLAAPEEVVGEAEVDPVLPEVVVGDAAEEEVGNGNIVLEGVVADPPGDAEEFVDLERLLTHILDQPVARFLESIGLMTGLSPSAIEYHLTVDTYMGASPQICSICLENIESGTQAGWLPCRHVYHPACIAHWLARTAVCPICRLKLSSNIGD